MVMDTRPASEPASLVVGLTSLCGLALGTGWFVLHGGSLAVAIPAMGALTIVFVILLVRRPGSRR
jgi:hypothetical protein